MDLSDNDFTGTVPSSFSSLILLETLDLHTNRLVGTIPDSFGGLASLRTYLPVWFGWRDVSLTILLTVLYC